MPATPGMLYWGSLGEQCCFFLEMQLKEGGAASRRQGLELTFLRKKPRGSGSRTPAMISLYGHGSVQDSRRQKG